jgi:hypothetical protein
LFVAFVDSLALADVLLSVAERGEFLMKVEREMRREWFSVWRQTLELGKMTLCLTTSL